MKVPQHLFDLLDDSDIEIAFKLNDAVRKSGSCVSLSLG